MLIIINHHYPLVNLQKAIEHDHFKLIYPFKMVTFHGHVGSPEDLLLKSVKQNQQTWGI